MSTSEENRWKHADLNALDIGAAEIIMGWSHVRPLGPDGKLHGQMPGHHDTNYRVPPYSTNESASQSIDQTMKAHGWSSTIDPPDQDEHGDCWLVGFHGYVKDQWCSYYGCGETPAEARCRAALLAVEASQVREYDSTQDTWKHIHLVRQLLEQAADHLLNRARMHDASKLVDPEKAMLDAIGPQTNLPAYGSPADLARREAITTFLQIHHRQNDHHPEHYPNGIAGMSWLALIELLADWHAAGLRHAGGNLRHSLEHNRKRFGMSDELYGMCVATAQELGWWPQEQE